MDPSSAPWPPLTWLVTDGATGNLRQAQALAAALGVAAREWIVRPAPPWGWLAPHWRFGAGLAMPQALHAAARTNPPQLVIGCGRRAALATHWLRARHGAFAVQVLDPRSAPSHWDVVVAPAHDRLVGDNVIAVSGALHAITAGVLAEAALRHADLARVPAPRTALLVGGPNHAQRIDARYVDALVERLRGWHAHDGGGFLVTTSRRTPPAVLRRLRDSLADLPCRVWGSEADGANPYLGMLAHAQRIVVTPDSANLMSEACATGKPVFVFAPEPVRGKLGDLYQALLAEGRVRPLREAPAVWTPPAPAREAQAVAAQVWSRFRARMAPVQEP